MSDDGRQGLGAAPKGWRFDAFADVRMGRSLFDMRPEDWLVRDNKAVPIIPQKESRP